MLVLILFAAMSAPGSAETLRAGCSASDEPIAAIDATDRVEVLLALSGDEGDCYKVRISGSGPTLTGYVMGQTLPAVKAFVHDRQRVSQRESEAEARAAAAPPARPTTAPAAAHLPAGLPARFEDFSEPNDSGGYLRLSGMQGRVTLVTFWSPKSTRSRNQMVTVLPLYQSLRDKGLAAVGVSMDPEPGDITAALDDVSLPWPQVADRTGLARRYHVDPRAGEVFVLDSSRNIVAAGPMGADIVSAVRKLLGPE